MEDRIRYCAYGGEGSDCTVLLSEEKVRCNASFLEWLKWAKLIEAPTLGNSGGIIKLELWEHLKVVIAHLRSKRLITILKSRQIGLSYIISAYVLWFAMTHEGATVLLFSKGEDEAFELLNKCYNLYEQLPEFLKLPLDPSSKGTMGFPYMHSVIKAMPSTESAGVSYNASIIVYDEHDVHEYAAKSYFHAKPAIDSQGGQLISVFTVNPFDENTLAKSLFKEALSGNNDFTPLFFPYWVRPGRDKAWYEYVKRNTSIEELGGLNRDLYMQKNFPSSIAEALRPTAAASVFNMIVLDEMMGDTKNPLSVHIEDIDSKIVNIYRDFHIGEFYIAATDTSHGVGKDFSVTVILNIKSSAVVADIISSRLPPEELALHSVRLLSHYHNPLWFIENNEWGRVVISMAQTLGYKRLGYHDKKKTKIGWHTDEKTRFDLWGKLIPAINDHQLTIFSKDGLKQFYGIIRNTDKEGRIEASTSNHDDYPIAVGIAWAKKDEVLSLAWPTEPIESLHFRKM